MTVPRVDDAFLLTPFLVSLGDDFPLGLRDYERISVALRSGGPWTVDQLRYVLLALVVRQQEQEDVFLRRFDDFFDRTAAPAPRIEAGRVLEELRQYEPRQDDVGVPVDRPPAPLKGPKEPAKPWRFYVAAVVLVGVLGLVLWYLGGPRTQEPIPPLDEHTDEHSDEPPIPPPETEPKAEEQTVSVPTLIAEGIPTPGADDWKKNAGAFVFFLLAFLGYGGYLSWLRRPPRDRPDPPPKADAPRLFEPTKIGGPAPPRLDDETLDILADSLGYFHGETPSRKLDVTASVTATGRNAGLPRLVFERKKQMRRVVILEDADAAPLDWNPIAGELATGLLKRGVPVVHGRFHGVPDCFHTADGEVHLEDLEDDLGHVLLIFSDGKGLRFDRQRGHPRHVFEALVHWPRVAWMEPREPRAWDASTAVPARFGLPVFPASPAGLMQAFGRFLTERAPQTSRPDPRAWHGLAPRLPEVGVDVHVEAVLGDALLWAQATAMMMPPTGLGLAEALRKEFHPEVPSERLERLAALPGTVLNRDGLRFSRPVLAVLRRGFVDRRDRSEQERVLGFLMERIREAAPEERDSAEYRAWEWRLERVRLELEPDRALRRLAELAAGPLGESIRGELAVAAVADKEDAVPLRTRPEGRRGLQRLWLLNRDVGVQQAEAFQLDRLQAGALLGLAMGCLIWAGISAGLYFKSYDHVLRFKEDIPKDALFRVLEDDNWRSWRPDQDLPLPSTSETQVAILREGLGATLPIPTTDTSRQLRSGTEDKPCRESLPNLGLHILRCPETGPRMSWRRSLDAAGGADLAPGRVLSVGMEIDAVRRPYDADSGACDLLLDESSIDICFSVYALREARMHLAIEHIEKEIGPWLADAQLVWWPIKRGDFRQLVKEPSFLALSERFARSRQVLSAADSEGAMTRMGRFLRPGPERVLTEADILDFYKIAEFKGEGKPIYLFRPQGVPEPTLLKQVLDEDPESAFAALAELTTMNVDSETLLAQVRQRKRPFDVLELDLESVGGDHLRAALRVVDLLLPLDFFAEHVHQFDPTVDWPSVRGGIVQLPYGDRRNAILLSLLYAWRDVPFTMGGDSLSSGFDSPRFIRRILSDVGLDVEAPSGVRLSTALMQATRQTDNPKPGDLVFFQGIVGSFGLILLSPGNGTIPPVGIGTLQRAEPLQVISLANINTPSFPLIGYFEVVYPDERIRLDP